jgi:hypothetical protein
MSNSDHQKCACAGCGGHIEYPSGRAGELISCPHCGGQTKLASVPEISPEKPAKKTGNVTAAILVVLILAAAGEMYYRLKINQPSASPALVLTPALTNVFIPKAFQDFDNFKVNKITLKKSDEGGLVYAFGIVKNDTNRQRLGVKVILDLHNWHDVKIGSASDYISVLEPHQQWQFKALVTDPKTVSAVLARIEEEK